MGYGMGNEVFKFKTRNYEAIRIFGKKVNASDKNPCAISTHSHKSSNHSAMYVINFPVNMSKL